MLSLLGIIIALALLIFLAMKGFNIILISPILAIVVMVLSGMPIVETLSGTYMTGFAGFLTKYFLIFFLGSVFGKLMDDSGAAKSIANGVIKLTGEKSKFAVIIATMVITALLTYGGLSLFVAVFALVPISRPIYKRLNIPWYLFVGAFMFGMGTFTMTMIPGSPQIQNIIPTTVLGTKLTAAPAVGLIAAATVIAFNTWWLFREMKRLDKLGIGFEETKGTIVDVELDPNEEEKLPHFALAIIPLVFLLVVLNVAGIPIVGTLLLTCVLTVLLYIKHFDDLKGTLGLGATNVMSPILNTCAIVGFGAVVASTVGYQFLVNGLTSMPGSPLISWVIGINILAGVTGSASGGLSIAMQTLTPHYIDLVNPEVLHRLASIASGGLDSLPHNGAVVTSLMVFGLTHKTGYKYIFFMNTVGPLVATVVALIAAMIIY